MSKRIFLNIFIFISFLFCKSFVFGQKIADFNVGSHRFYTESESYTNFFCYLGSAEASDKNVYSLARIKRLKKKGESYKLEALAPEKIKLNGRPGQVNPLNGAKISLLNLITLYPVVVKDGDNKIYFMASLSEDPKMESALYSSKEVNDANRKPCSKILSMAITQNPSLLGNCIFLAVKNNTGEVFGSEGSGIAVAFFNDDKLDLEEKNVKTGKVDKKSTKIIDLRLYNAELKDKPELEEKDADASDDKKKQKEDKKVDEKKPKGPMIPKADNKAVSINGSIDAVRINNDAVIMSDIVDMHWDKELNTLYVAVTVKSGNAANSGARAVFRGQISQDNIQAKKLKLLPIALDHVFKGNNNIVGTGEPNQEVSIQKVRTLHTSTLLDYLIVVGGNGSESAVGNKVYALPLVNNQKEINLLHEIKDVKEKKNIDILRKALVAKHGSLAKYNQAPKDYYNNEFFLTRSFVQEANSSHDLVTNNESSARVGLEDLPLQSNEKISDIFVVNDSVFVTIANEYNGVTTPGIFHSQAIFDDKGRIASWTKWLRVAGMDTPVLGAGLDVSIGAFWYIAKDSSTNKSTVNVTKWSKDEDQLSSFLNNQFLTKQGGVQGFFDISKNNPGFNNFSIMIATGFKKIGLIETGSVKNGVYRATKDISKKVVLFDDKSLEPVGPIVAADVSNNVITHDNWIIVGGVGGIAVLCDKNGICWKNKISSLGDIPGGLAFKKIGDYAFVKKIQSDGKFLYVMTGKKLDKIELSAESFKNGKLNVVKLADSLAQPGVVFNDFAVSDKFGILATSKGLFRVGNGKNIITAKNSEQVSWTFVKVPESVDVIAKLFLISPTGNDLDYAKKGQVYVLSAYRGTNQTKLNRLFVNLENEINDSTITPVNDLFIKNQLSSFFEFNSFREKFWTNGSLLMSICSTDLNSDLSLNILSPRVACSAKSVMIRNYLVDLEIEKIYQMGNVVRNSASGALMINGSFGLRVNA